MDIRIYLGPYIALPAKTAKQPITVRTCMNTTCSIKSRITTPFCSQCGSPIGNVILEEERNISPFDLPMPPGLSIVHSEQHGYFIVDYSTKMISSHRDTVTDLISSGIDEALSRFKQQYSDYIVELGRDTYGKKLEVSYGIITTWG